MTTRTAWRSVRPDFRSSHGYRWPFPGNTAEAPLPDGAEFTHGAPCPQFVSDGLCLAKTWRGALMLLDIFPWHMLSVVHVHPEFAERTLRAASARLAKEKSSHAESRLRRWQEKCRRPEAE